jgi:hypothetical protein
VSIIAFDDVEANIREQLQLDVNKAQKFPKNMPPKIGVDRFHAQVESCELQTLLSEND